MKMEWTLAFKKNLPLSFRWKLAGFNIIDIEDKFVSRVVDLLCEEESRTVRYIVGDIGGLMGISGKKVLVPASLIEPGGNGQVVATTTLEMIMSSPPLDDPENPTRDEEAALFTHYEAKAYWEPSGIETSPQKESETKDDGESIELEGMEQNSDEN